MEKRPSLIQILLFFLKTGSVTFGGGWSIVAQIESELVEKRGWLSRENLLDFTSVGKSLPGIMICNICYLCGFHMRGVLGGLAALFGVAFSPMVILCIVTLFYNEIKDSEIVMRAMVGIRAAVVPIIGFTAWKMQKDALHDPFSVLLALACLLLALFSDVLNVYIVIGAAAAGILYGSIKYGSH